MTISASRNGLNCTGRRLSSGGGTARLRSVPAEPWSKEPAIFLSAGSGGSRFAGAMKPGDLSFCTYRGHAHTLARGVPVEKSWRTDAARDNGLMRGKGGSMHLTSVDHGVMGSYAIIGAHLPSPLSPRGALNTRAIRTYRSASLATARQISALSRGASILPRCGSCQ